MDIKINSSKLELGANVTLTKDEAVSYITKELQDIVDTFELSPVKINVKMHTEGDPNDPVQKVDITLNTRKVTLNQSNHSRNIKRAIDKAIAELERQVRKMKEKRRDKPRNAARRGKYAYQNDAVKEMQNFIDGDDKE